MPFNAAPVPVPTCDVSDVVASLDAVRVVIIHAGQVGTYEIFHLACKGARRTRSALAAALDVGIKFPTVFTEPARKEGGKPFTMLSAIADASFLSTLASRPGALVRRLEGRAVVVTVVLPAFPIYHAVDRRADPEGEGKGKGKGKGKGGGKGSDKGRGKGGVGPDDDLLLHRSVILTVEMALFDDRFCTANLHDGPRRPPLPSVPMNELSGLIVVPDLPVRVDATQPLLLRALVTALGASFDARILPVPVWELRLDYDNAALVGFGAVVTGLSVPFRSAAPAPSRCPSHHLHSRPPSCLPASRCIWLPGASPSGSAVADFAVTLLPLSVLLPSAMHLVNNGGAHHLEPVAGSESLARVLLFGGRSQLSSCFVQLLSASESSPAFATRALLMGGAGAVAGANLSLAPLGLSIADPGGPRGGGGALAMAPSPPGIAQRFGGILLRELGAAACNRAVLGRSQFCGRACTEVATFLLARELLPAGEASLRRHLPALVALLSLAPGVRPPRNVPINYRRQNRIPGWV